MDALTLTNARVLTLAGPPPPRRGDALGELGVIDRGFVRVEGDRIADVGPVDAGPRPDGEVVDVGGCVVMPGFVDCHTHACWAGERFDEADMRRAGRTYLEILEAGGGIMATVRAVRAASEDALTGLLLQRLARMAALGTTTVEVKSGYGLTTDDELKMLRAVHEAARLTDLTVVASFLGAHAVDPQNPSFIEQTIQETLPAVTEEFPGIVCDAYCEQGAWSLHDTGRLFQKAADLGCPLRVHADQFNSLGMTPLAVAMGAVSVDHLEATTPQDLRELARSDTIGVALPACGFQLDDRFAPARQLIDAGGALALATNYNPGSAPTPSVPFVIALATRKLGLSAAEAVAACTVNAACVLGLQDDVGTIEKGKRADVQILDCTDPRELAFEFAGAGPRLVLSGGQVVCRR
ncbi:MAG: imidazolonepropionase [Planctomycetota bacterium]|jgi:imidazolonepropionase